MPAEPPSGRQHAVAFGDQQAVVVEVGAAVRSYRVAGREVLSGYDENEKATSARGQVLIPWPNRMRDGQYTWEGTEQQLPLSEPEKHNAIHGLVRWANWTTGRHTTSEVELRHVLHRQPGYPFTLELAVTYRLDETGSRVTTTATNAGDDPAPYAAGQHPYLAAPDLVDDCHGAYGFAEQVTKHGEVCSSCTVSALALVPSVPAAWPEARDALRAVRTS